MKEVEQNYRTGTLRVTEVPEPSARRGNVLLRNAASLVSAGTEKGMIDFARKSLLGKAKSRPDLVKQVIDKFRTEGILETWRQVMGRLDTPVLLGYSSAGIVTQVGDVESSFAVGDRVACTGSGFAGHAEVVSVPAHLCVHVPSNVSLEQASFCAVGGIGLEAVRMSLADLGGRVVVIGLGLLGQIVVQQLDAAGCHVFGVDIDARKTGMASQYGAEAVAAGGATDVVDEVASWTQGQGADAVIILAATPSNEPLEQAAAMCRERGRVVATGMVGLQVPRRAFYDKELELVVSRAWGPGLYDVKYVDKQVDYPLPYARWTANRNLEEFMSQLGKGTVQVEHLITHRFSIEAATEAYEMILAGKDEYIGTLLKYPDTQEFHTTIKPTQPPDLDRTANLPKPAAKLWMRDQRRGPSVDTTVVSVGLVGAGVYANGTMLPIIRKLPGIRLRGIASMTGRAARHAATKYGFDYCSTDHRQLLDDPELDLLLILTRHGSHASIVKDALEAGKHVFVEKPLALDIGQLRTLVDTYMEAQSSVSTPRVAMVGFNRRFSPFSKWLKDRFESISQPLTINCVVNAGSVLPDSWVNDQQEGGGRIIGEVCHFIDIVQYITSSMTVRTYAQGQPHDNGAYDDSVVVTLEMANGSRASITYAARGDKRFPRERIEVFGGGAVGTIQNFKSATFIKGGRRKRSRNWFTVDRGHQGEMEALISAIRDETESPVPFDDYLNTTLATFAAEKSLLDKKPVAVDLASWGKTLQDD